MSKGMMGILLAALCFLIALFGLGLSAWFPEISTASIGYLTFGAFFFGVAFIAYAIASAFH